MEACSIGLEGSLSSGVHGEANRCIFAGQMNQFNESRAEWLVE